MIGKNENVSSVFFSRNQLHQKSEAVSLHARFDTLYTSETLSALMPRTGQNEHLQFTVILLKKNQCLLNSPDINKHLNSDKTGDFTFLSALR